jgi:parallel beta-helix repeat protein
VIEGNLILQTNYRNEWGGAENAGIKLHETVDAVIRNNCILGIRGTFTGGPIDASGIWLDWSNQNCRISGNVISGCAGQTIKLEANHGPILVDNNILAGSKFQEWGQGTILVHNLFDNCLLDCVFDNGRSSQYYPAHSVSGAGSANFPTGYDKWYNNIFIGKGLDNAPTSATAFAANNNVYLDGARKAPFEGAGSVADASINSSTFSADSSQGVIAFSISAADLGVACQQITGDLIGVLPVPNVKMDNPDGTPLTVNTDYFGRPIDAAHVLPGPFQTVAQGANYFKIWPRGSGPSIMVTPDKAVVKAGDMVQYAAKAKDQYGADLPSQPLFTWAVSGGGAISQSGLFTVGTTGTGIFAVTASAAINTAALTGSAQVIVSDPSNTTLPPGYISKMLVLKNDATNSYYLQRDTAHSLSYDFLNGESSIAPNEGNKAAVEGRSCTWKVDSTATGQWATVGPQDNFVFYAAITIISAGQQNASLAIYHDDGAKIWQDGQVIASWSAYNNAEDIAPVTLKAGANRFLFKLIENGGGNGMSIRFLDANGFPINGLSYRLNSTGNGTAARASLTKNPGVNILRIRSNRLSVIMTGARPQTVKLMNMKGSLLAAGAGKDCVTLHAPLIPGIYMVRIGNDARKIVVDR